MSLRLRERVWVAMSPRTVTCLRRPGFGPGRLAHRSVKLVAQAAEGPDWRPAVDVLRAWVATQATAGTGSADVRVVLSNHFVRLLVVPWSDALTGADERLALARHLFRSTYGDAADGWQVQLAPTGHGQPTLACAVDQALHEALAALLAGTTWRLVSLQPLLTVVFNAYRRELGNDAALFVLEPGRSCCVAFRAGRWEAARMTRRTAPSPDAAVERERRLLGLPEDFPSFVYTAADRPVPTAAVPHGASAEPARCRHLGAASARRPDAMLTLFMAAA